MILDALQRAPDERDVVHADCFELAGAMRGAGVMVDALITDTPYSARTHAGHDAGTRRADRWPRACGTPDNGQPRRALGYGAWDAAQVHAFMLVWEPLTRGWMVALTDHVLAPEWEASMRAAGRYVFAPLACTEPGSRVRLGGDGPTNWTVWAVVSRPRTQAFARWGALPGAYIVDAERRTGRRSAGTSVVGGKPLSLMRALVRDYSRLGDLVCDPCCGAGTTLLAAKLEGRHAIGSDCDPHHVAIAQRRLRLCDSPEREEQMGLFT